MYSSRVVLSTANNGHPVYNTYVRWSVSLDEWCVAHRFAGYRDLNLAVTALGATLKAEFPPTYSKSKFGLQLSARELEDRRASLELWVCELLTTNDSWPENIRHLVHKFFDLEAHPAPSVHPGSAPRSSDVLALPPESKATGNSGSSGKARTQSNMSAMSEPIKEVERQVSVEHQRAQSSVAQLSIDLRAHAAEKLKPSKDKSKATTKPLQQPKPDKLHVSVRRGEEHKGHPTYDTKLQFVRTGVAYTVTHRFAAFRTLDTDLQQAQIVVHAPFPTTYAKSSIGLKLAEPELQERARNLDLWMKEVLTSFHTYPDRAQLLLYDFLKLESCTNSDVEHTLTEGRVVANVEDAEKEDVAEAQSSLEEVDIAPTVAKALVAVPNVSVTSSSTDQPHVSVEDAPLHSKQRTKKGCWCSCW